MEPKEFYDMLLETGELDTMYDLISEDLVLTGRWEDDKEIFTKMHKDNLRAMEGAKNLYVDFEEDND